MLLEKKSTNSINLKNFYLRRIFRIWPLYYFTIIISLILIFLNIVPQVSNLYSSLFFYVFFMANIGYIMNLAISSVTPLWSVGVEEQFYLIWPHILKRTTKYLEVFICLFLLFLIFKFTIYITLTPKSVVYKFFNVTKIDVMTMGAIGAILVYSKSRIIQIIYRKEVQLISWLILLYSICYEPIHFYSFIDSELNAVFYLIIILNVSTNKDTLFSLENKFMNFIGKISYGIYVYHMIIIYLVSFTLKILNYQLNHISIFLIILILTTLVATLSYKLIETPFLRMKDKYSIIKSTNTK
ncbi:MAG: acyltransferase [Bacteroidia bacterium]|nr:acyltransferase [Bacteroidia bacterium]